MCTFITLYFRQMKSHSQSETEAAFYEAQTGHMSQTAVFFPLSLKYASTTREKAQLHCAGAHQSKSSQMQMRAYRLL